VSTVGPLAVGHRRFPRRVGGSRIGRRKDAVTIDALLSRLTVFVLFARQAQGARETLAGEYQGGEERFPREPVVAPPCPPRGARIASLLPCKLPQDRP